jgi:hypothetical protein
VPNNWCVGVGRLAAAALLPRRPETNCRDTARCADGYKMGLGSRFCCTTTDNYYDYHNYDYNYNYNYNYNYGAR